jgi:POT family proton-dependent oligopeptide transporter
MRALLTLYMVKYLLLSDHADQVLGLSTLRNFLESFSGPLDTQPFASLIYGLYTGLVYLTPVFGGLLADRILGQRRTIVIGGILMMFGHFLMACESCFLLALLLLILGNGAFKPNLASQVGGLYAKGDSRRDRAYSIYYVGVNLGALFSPLVCGTLGEEVGWHYGFGAAGVGMFIGVVTYLYGLRHLPPDHISKTKTSAQKRTKLTRQEWYVVLALLVLCLPNTFFWAAYEQIGNTIALWADKYTDRSVNLLFWKGEIPATWFQAVNPFFIFTFTPLVIMFWTWQTQHRSEPTTVVKMALGCFAIALANLIMFAVALHTGSDGKTHWLWLIAYFAVVTLGELYFSPTGLSLVSKMAPMPIRSMMMGVWFITNFVGNLMSGWLGSFWSHMEKASFFLMIAAITAGAGAVIWLISKQLNKIFQE